MRNKMRNRKEWKAMNNEVVKKPRGPKAFFKKVYRYRYTLILAYYPMAGVVMA